MDSFREVRGQSLHRRGTPFNRAQSLDLFRPAQLSITVCGFAVTFLTGLFVGFVSAFIFLINS